MCLYCRRLFSELNTLNINVEAVVLNRCPSAQCQSWYYFILTLFNLFFLISLIHRFKCTTLILVHLYEVQKMFLLCVTSRISRYEVLPFTDNSNHAFCVAFVIIWRTDLFIYQRKKKKSQNEQMSSSQHLETTLIDCFMECGGDQEIKLKKHLGNRRRNKSERKYPYCVDYSA